MMDENKALISGKSSPALLLDYIHKKQSLTGVESGNSCSVKRLLKPVCNASAKTNAKVQIFPDGYMKLTTCSDRIFLPSGYEKIEDDYEENVIDNPLFDSDDGLLGVRADSIRRARSAIFNICMLNDFTHFATWTNDQKVVDRHDDEAVKKKLQYFLWNSVKRKNLKYIFVPERHKDGAVHWHGLIKGNYDFVDSGTVATKERKKPVRPSTAKRFGLTVIGPVYNVADWRNGWSTAIELYDERKNVSKYIAKYVTKESEKIYGKFYFAGGHGLIRKPQTICIDVDFERIPGKAYQVEGMNRCFRYMECYRLDDRPLVGA